MKHFQYIFLIIAFMSFFSCKEKPTEKLEIIRTYTSREVHARSLIDKVDFVKLETKKGNLIGEVSKLLFTDSLIIVIDKTISKSIYVFSINGQFIRKIGALGQGPAEYNYISDVILSYDKTKLHVLARHKLVTYNLNGTFLRSQNTKLLYHLIENIDKKKFAMVNILGILESEKSKKNNLLQIVDKEFDSVIYSDVESSYQPGGILMGYATPLINVNGKVFLLPNLSDTIFQVTDEKVIPRYYIKTKKKKPGSNELINSAKRGEFVMEDKFNGGFYHIGNNVIIPIMSSSKPLVFYNTKSKKTYSYDSYKLNEDHPLLVFTNTLKTQYKSSLVTVVTPGRLIARKDLFYKCYDKKMIDRLFKNMTEDDNPVLLFYHVNKIEPL